jgi:hypothetical protein
MEEEAVFAKKMQKRSIPTVDGTSPFRFFDGAVMGTFRYPPKAWETVFCRRPTTSEPSCTFGGRGFIQSDVASEPTCRSQLIDEEQTCSSNQTGILDDSIHSPLIAKSTMDLLGSGTTRLFDGPDLARRVKDLFLEEDDDIFESLRNNATTALNETALRTPAVYNPVQDRQIHFHHGVLGHRAAFNK